MIVSLSIVYPPEAMTALSLVVEDRFLTEAAEPGALQTDQGEDFTFSDGSTREVNPG